MTHGYENPMQIIQVPLPTVPAVAWLPDGHRYTPVAGQSGGTPFTGSIEFVPDNTFYIGAPHDGRPQGIFVGTAGVWLSPSPDVSPTNPACRIWSDGQQLINYTISTWIVVNQTTGVDMMVYDDVADRLELHGGISPGDTTTTGSKPSIYAGNGAPASTLGALGDFYFRNGTPTVVNQRIYNKQSTGWVGIL